MEQKKKYDVKQLVPKFPLFQQLLDDPELFGQVTIDAGGYGISWSDELDIDGDELWEYGIQTDRVLKFSVDIEVAHRLSTARRMAGYTQKQLAEKTGIAQGDISKIENGLANPSLSTLKRLAEAMNMKVEINFVPDTV